MAGPRSFRTHCAIASAMGQRSVAAGITLTTALFGMMIPSSRTTSEAPH
jgi:hypothetical protein